MQDFRYAFRHLRRTPGFTSVAVLTLALGIGVNTAFFGIVNELVFRPVSASKLDGVIEVTRMDRRAQPGRYFSGLTVASIRAIEAHPPVSVAGVSGASVTGSMIVQTPGHAEEVMAESITAGYPKVLSLSAEAGRWISRDDDRMNADPVAVISDRLWHEWFGGDPKILGHISLSLSQHSFRIVGVAPRGFRGISGGSTTDLWLPLTAQLLFVPEDVRVRTEAGGGPFASMLVKMRAGVHQSQIEADVAATLVATPETSGMASTLVFTPAASTMSVDRTLGAGIAILVLSALVLVAACANLANMLYARGLQRAGEIAVRLSLGASRGNIMRLFLAEATIIAAASASLGLALTLGAISLFGQAFPALRAGRFVSVAINLSPDYRVFAVAFGAGAFAALFVGATAAWRSTRVPPLHTLASSGGPSGLSPRRGWLRTALVSVQITAAVILVMTTGVFLQNTPESLDRRLLFDTAHVVAGRIALSRSGYTASRGLAFVERLVHDLRALPGVEGAGFADGLPGGVGSAAAAPVTLSAEGRPDGPSGALRGITASYSCVSPGLLHAIDVPLRRGRDFASSDAYGEPLVGIVSESAAALLWPGQDAIGKRALFGTRVWLTVIGVSADPTSGRSDSPLTQPSNFLFVPYAQFEKSAGPQAGYRPRYGSAFIVLRSPTPAAHIDALRATAKAIDPEVAVLDAATIDQSLFAWYAPQRAARVLMTLLGALALGIAMLGVYGLVAYFVTARTREFGIRLALGSTPARLMKLVIDHAVHIVLIGLLPGVFVASVASRLFESHYLKLMPNEISTWIVVPLLILAAGIVAGSIPAWRAARVDPNVALREA